MTADSAAPTSPPASLPAGLAAARYAILRSYRADGSPVDTPIWFAYDGANLLFRTKIGPKTRRISAHPGVRLQPCDYRGRPTDTVVVEGTARILSGAAAEAANRVLHRRYGWQWNILPVVKLPGVVNAHRDLPLPEKFRRARTRTVWPDSAIVSIAIDRNSIGNAASR